MGAAVVLACFVIVLLVPVVLFLLTYIFRQSCVLCGLPKPSVLTAAGVMLVNALADGIAFAVLEKAVLAAGQAAGLPRWESWLIAGLLDLPVDLLISSGIHAGLMGIKFGKGIEVWFVQRLIYLAIFVLGLAAVAIVFAVMGAIG